MPAPATTTMTPGNRLYLYRLLADQIGVGKQVPIEQAEEVLRADDVLPQDVGFETAQAMLESDHFAGIARVDVFKKGRILVTMLPSAEMDEASEKAALAEANQAAEKAGANAGGKGAAKAKGPSKGSSKGKAGKAGASMPKAPVKPSKPGKQRRRQEMKEAKAAAEEQARREAAELAERQAREAAERAEAERVAREQAEREAKEKAEREMREAAERARREAEQAAAKERARKETAERALEEQMARVTTPIAERDKPGLRITYDPYEGMDEAIAAAVAETQGAEQPPQPEGPSLAEVVGRMLSGESEAGVVVRRAAKKPKATKAARGKASEETTPAGESASAGAGVAAGAGESVTPGVSAPVEVETAYAAQETPTRAEGRTASEQGVPADRASAAGETAPAEIPSMPEQAASSPDTGERAASAPAPVDAVAAVEAEAPTEASVHTGAAAAMETSVSATTPAAEEAPVSAQASVAPETPAAREDVVESGFEGFSSAAAATPAPAAPTRARDRAADRQIPSAAVLADYPRSVSRDVFCPTALLSTLTRVLPLTVDVMALLDEDWAMARATGTVTGSRSRATFPLRYLREDGTQPVEVTLKRGVRSGSTVRWEMALVDGDDGHGDVHQTASLDGLPLADEGAWSDLNAGILRGAQPVSPIRAFAQFAVIGTWDAMLGELARTAAPERWTYPGTEIIPSTAGATRYPLLREYLAVTFQRVREQGELVVAPSGGFAAFNTGLVTASLDDIHACFEPSGVDVPWRFVGFAQAGSGELGRRIASELDRVPKAATYLETLEDVVPAPGSELVLDFRTLLGDCLGRLPRGFLREVLADMEGPNAMVDAMVDPSLPPSERAGAQTRLARFIADAPLAHRRLSRALDDAAQTALVACRRSYRVAAPVYDPATGRMKLLLPLCLVDDRRADVALVAQRQPSGIWQGVGLTTLPRAYACARVVSAEQPAWLAPDVVLR